MEAVNEYLIVKKEVIEEERSKGGIILNVSSVFDFGDRFSKKNVVKAEVVYANHAIPFLKSGERIVVNPNKGAKATMDWEDFTVITKEQYIAKIDKDGKYIVPPDCIMLKIQKEQRDNLYSKWIIRNDGTKVQLFLQPEPDKNSTQRSKIYVSLAEVMQVGDTVSGIYYGDIAILDYTIDNDIDNVLYYDEEDNKYIVVQATTILHTHDEWAYATRNFPKDQKVAKAGDIETMSPILGLIRNEKLVARFPYIFINHESATVQKVSKFGIMWTEQQFVLEREVLSVSDESKKRYGIKEGQSILVQDPDIFLVQLKDSKVDCILDQDVMLGFKK